MADYRNMGLLTSYRILHLMIAASWFTVDFELCVLGHIVNGCIGSVAVYQPVNVLVLYPSGWHG